MKSLLLCIIYIKYLSSSMFLGSCRSSRALFFSGSGFTPSEENNIPQNFISFEPKVYLFGLRHSHTKGNNPDTRAVFIEFSEYVNDSGVVVY